MVTAFVMMLPVYSEGEWLESIHHDLMLCVAPVLDSAPNSEKGLSY